MRILGKRKNGGNRSSANDIYFITDDLRPAKYKIRKAPDTLKIKTHRPFVEITHKYKRINNANYIFERGDTVVFSYADKVPYAKVINRHVEEIDLNFDVKSLSQENISFEGLFTNPISRRDNNDSLQYISESFINSLNVTGQTH